MRTAKMRDYIIAGIMLLAIFIGSQARATGNNHDDGQDQDQHQGQAQGQIQGQAQGQGQSSENTNINGNRNDNTAIAGAIAGASANNQVDASSATDVETNVNVEGDSYDIPSNSAFAPMAFSNMRCSSVFGAAFTNANGSGSFGLPVPRWLSRKLKDCQSNADANWLAEMGMRLAAIEARCSTKSMQERFGGSQKGGNRTTACITTLTESVRQDEILKGLRDTVGRLQHQNGVLEEQVARAESVLEGGLNK